jgi:hypothetical protein
MGRAAKESPAMKKSGGDLMLNGSLLLTSDELKQLKGNWKTIDSYGTKIASLMISATQRYYLSGEILWEAAMRYKGKINYKILSKAVGAPSYKISNSIKIYQLFKDHPDEIEHLSVQDAFKLIRDRESSGGKQKRIEYGPGNGQKEFDWEQVFEQDPVASVPLKNYRIACPDDHALWLYRRGMNFPTQFLEIKAGNETDPVMKLAYSELVKEIQMASEKYLLIKEQREEQEEENA